MTYRDGVDDDALRDALHGAMPTDVELRFERIDARADRLRRNNRARGAVALVAVAALALVGASMLHSGAAHERLDIVAPPAELGTTATAPPTTAGSRPSPPTTHPLVVPFTTTVPVVVTSPPTTTRVAVPAPATTVPAAPHTTAAPPAPTTTVAPAPTHIRITLVLDDAGLHAPAVVATADLVDVVFLDQRTTKSSEIEVRVTDPAGTSVWLLRPWYDADCCGHFGAIIGLQRPVGRVTYQAYDKAAQADIAGESAQTELTS